MPRFHAFAAFALVSFGWLQSACATGPPSAGADVALSQIDFTATLSLGAIQDKLRSATAEAIRSSPPAARTYGPKTVRVKVTPSVDAARLSVTGLSNGTIRISVPVRVRVDTAVSGGAELAVYADGCKATTFMISADFTPVVTPDGGLSYSLSDVTNNNRRYRCSIVSNSTADAGKHIGEFFASGFGFGRTPDYSKVADVDVSRRIQGGLRAFGRAAFRARADDFDALLPDESALYAMLRKPAMFGNALTLGIHALRLRVTKVAAQGDQYQVSGVLEGQPRLVFGDTWVKAPVVSDQAADPGFHLPARLLFPTNTRLLPDSAVRQASGCVGGFRLSSVPDRQDLAVLQRCEAGAQGNVVWLSGTREPPSGKVHAYNRSMSNVLGEIIDWLGDRALWRGVEGAAKLHHRMLLLRQRLDLFQQGTEIPVDTRGRLHFSRLSVDLNRVWVSEEAILADVILNGKARLDIQLAL